MAARGSAEVTHRLGNPVNDPDITTAEGLALASVGAIALAMPRTITASDPVAQLPELAHYLDQAVDAGRRARA
ncbi:hypothetical protein ACIRRH_41510 [Kitasatospora sp. NPDC101235]|uniref:hypothetical protein n=1 Tax=Kitasatospora sp. NPDC101235 TaxID=3364101 RepID=UPI003814C6E4